MMIGVSCLGAVLLQVSGLTATSVAYSSQCVYCTECCTLLLLFFTVAIASTLLMLNNTLMMVEMCYMASHAAVAGNSSQNMSC
jgi:hypothetical protein